MGLSELTRTGHDILPAAGPGTPAESSTPAGADPGDGAGWEVAWIDIGGEG